MQHNIIWFEKAARKWEDGLPLGNGRLGAMTMGKVNDETIFINEETLWYGPPRVRRNREAKQNIEQIRRLLLAGEISEAEFQAKLALTSTPKYNNPFQLAGDMRISLKNHNKKVSGYRRSLDVDHALAHVCYVMDDITYKREMFVSAEYHVFAMKLTCSEGGMTLCVNMNRKPFEEHTGAIDEKTVGNWGVNGVGGVSYFTGIRLCADGEVSVKGDFAYVRDAKEVYIYLTSETDFGGNAGFRENCLARLDRAEADGYERVYAAHQKVYRSLYERLTLSVNDADLPEESTDKLMGELREGETKNLSYLSMLLFHYARYLMISCSYQSQLPANQQGIWNGSYEPPWQSQYTININTEMNYWFVEKAGLSECHQPLFDLIDRLVVNGKETASDMYGCRGFCAHHNTNLWACTDPEGIFAASPFWMMGGAWLALHLYEHYLYTEDEVFLTERALPVMKEAILFVSDYLYEDQDGRLLTGPSVSPENTYRLPNGEEGALCMAPTMDTMIIRQLITWYLEGSKVIGSTEDMTRCHEILEHLPKTALTKDGRIMEWYEDFEETEPGHRHISHLFGLHPGTEITTKTQETYQAARKTVDYRLSHGGGHTGWSKAWVTCFYARLHDGDAVDQNIKELLQHSVLDNMLDVHPPFQIDGNFGIAEAMLESLIQSHAGYIDVLPALPKSWRSGELHGIRLRGNMVANLIWKDGELASLEIRAEKARDIVVVCGDKEKKIALEADRWTTIGWYE